MTRPRVLFDVDSLSTFLSERSQTLFRQIDRLSSTELASSSDDQLTASLVQQYSLNPVLLRDSDSITMDPPAEVQRQNGDRTWRTTICKVYLEFTGDPELFKYHPGTRPIPTREMWVEANSLVTEFDVNESNGGNDIRREFEGVRGALTLAAQKVAVFNESLPTMIRDRLSERRREVAKVEDTFRRLGFSLRRRNDAEISIVLPPRQKPVALVRAPGGPTPVDVYLASKDYEDILSSLRNMATVLERSPKSFATLNEEALRWILLVGLNGLYEGQASGETFNFEGKTDILIRAGGKNVFVAECKIWRGATELQAAIDQLTSIRVLEGHKDRAHSL